MASEGIGIARQGPDIAEQVVNCPRCDSPNTKFCYYNNYSLSQPRHFCKTCRRYWTKGGALRNVPVGGGSRKNKRLSKSSVLSRLSLVNNDHPVLGTNYSDPGISLQNLLSGPSQLVPASTDFQLGVFPFSRMSSPSSYNNISTTTNNKFMSVNGDQIIPQNIASPFGNKVNTSSSTSIGTNMASSIESLSFINQDLHLKLQQQRMCMLYAKESNETMATKDSLEGNVGPQSSDFAETSGLQRGWYVENSFAETTGTGTGTSASISNNDTCNNMNIGNNGNNLSYWNGNGSSSWNEIPQFAAMQ